MLRYSIKVKIAFGIVILFSITSVGLASNTIQAARAVREQAVSSYTTSGAAIVEQIDFQLEGVDTHLHALTVSDYNLSIIRNSLNVDEVTFANVRFQSILSSALSANQMVSSFFLFDRKSGRYWDVYNPNTTYEEREHVRAFLKNHLSFCELTSQSDAWFVQRVNGKSYLINVRQYGNIYLGAWTSAQTLYNSLGDSMSASAFFLIDETGEVIAGEYTASLSNLSFAGLTAVLNTGDELLIANHSRKGDFALVAYLSDDELMRNLPRISHFVLSAVICLTVLLPVVILFFRHTITKPVSNIVQGLRAFGQGDVETRMELRPQEGEFYTLKREFNRMADQIKTLQIDVYEEKLARQKAELQYLEMQINPHFLLNALNGIYSFAVSHNTDMVRKMILLLSGYLRQSFHSSFTVVPLREELDHTQRYLQIQQLRFQNRITTQIDVPEFLLDVAVPTLCLHTFVENAIKYQTSDQDHLFLILQAQMVLEGHTPYLRLEIQDNGSGFSDEVLDKVLGDQPLIDRNGNQHIGIWNFRQRLQLLYGGKARFLISNAPSSGAIVSIYIPTPEQGGSA